VHLVRVRVRVRVGLGGLGLGLGLGGKSPFSLKTTWCVQPDSELGAYLGVVRLDMGELAAGKRFVSPQLDLGDVVSFEPFWAAVKKAYGSPLPPSGHLAAGMMWPMLAGDDGSFTPLAYPPMHTHHMYASPENFAGPSIVFSHADSYCAERDDHIACGTLPP